MVQSVEALERGEPGLRTPVSTLLAATLVVVALAGTALGLGLSLATLNAPDAVRQEPIGAVATFAWVIILTAVGLVIRRHRADHQIAWLFLAFGTVAGFSHAIWGGFVVQRLPGGDPDVALSLAWLAATFTPVTWGYLIGALIVRFPSGRPETPTDAALLRLGAVAFVILGVLLAVRPGPFLVVPSHTNPLVIPEPLHGPVLVASTLAYLVALSIGAVAAWRMVGRYRRASVEGRLQLRWFAYAAALTVLGGSIFIVGGSMLGSTNPAFRDLTYTVAVLSGCSLPIAVVQAVTRHRLYDIDRIIGRTFAYGALTAILAGLYAASVRLFQGIFVAVTGDESDAALVLTTLVLATTFTPIKTRLEKLAEKRFKPVATPATSPGEPAVGDATFTADQLAAIDARIEHAVRRSLEATGRGRRPASR
jgi:hypothetical protein